MLYPVVMITIQLDDQADIIELALMVQQLLHELGRCDCEVFEVDECQE